MGKKYIKVFADAQSLSAYAAEFYLRTANEARVANQNFLVALSGGSTPARMYRLLAEPPFRDALAWDKSLFFWGDERCVPADDPESNYFQAYQLLLGPVGVPASNIFRVKGELEPDEAAKEYIGQLKLLAAEGRRFPAFDLVFLGLGSDGHTASLFPGSALGGDLPAMHVSASYQGRPASRVTLTPEVFNTASNVVFMAAGKDKADALFATLAGRFDPLAYPAQRITPENGNLIWLVDQSAAGMLPDCVDRFEIERYA